MCNVSRFYLLRKLYDAAFHKPGIYGSAPSVGGRGRRAAVWISSCILGGADFLKFFFCFLFFSSNAHGLLQVRRCLAAFTYLIVSMPLSPKNVICHSGLNVTTKRSLYSRGEW